MSESSSARRRAGTDANRRGRASRDHAWFVQRPDRVALWAFFMAVFAAIVAAASSAQADSGGVSSWAAAESSTGGAGGGTWTRSVATWYGPGFFGNRTACGRRLERHTVGVAHKKLPCGTEVMFAYRGRLLRARVIDRGPYTNGARWDLTQAAAEALRFKQTDTIRASVLSR